MMKTLEYLKEKKKNRQKITVLTAYDYPTTKILEETNIDMIILGDSVGTNVLGYKNETEVTLNDMIHHAKAVCRAKKDIFLVVDLPYGTYELPDLAVKNAKKLIEIGADAVKFEGIKIDILQALKRNNINVMCHIGLNPQHDQEKMQRGRISKGKLFIEATELIAGAIMLEKAGSDLIILEKIPGKISKIITDNLEMPTIGIGAGKYCDGQVLIIHDLLQVNEKKYMHTPEYHNIREMIKKSIFRYQSEVTNNIFPNEKHTNLIDDSEYNKIENWCLKNNIEIYAKR
jgi:3-methyl-2-oxobutanoate hydroxymethyltransferase